MVNLVSNVMYIKKTYISLGTCEFMLVWDIHIFTYRFVFAQCSPPFNKSSGLSQPTLGTDRDIYGNPRGLRIPTGIWTYYPTFNICFGWKC